MIRRLNPNNRRQEYENKFELKQPLWEYFPNALLRSGTKMLQKNISILTNWNKGKKFKGRNVEGITATRDLVLIWVT